MPPTADSGLPAELEELVARSGVELAGLLIEAHRGLNARLEAISRRHGLQHSDFSSLLRLSRSPGQQLRMCDLAAQTGTSTSGVTTIVERLLAQDLVTRAPGLTDRRSYVVRLSPAGAQRLTEALRESSELIENDLVAPVGEDAPAFERALRRVRDTVSPEATQIS